MGSGLKNQMTHGLRHDMPTTTTATAFLLSFLQHVLLNECALCVSSKNIIERLRPCEKIV
jgi:hypothetical protein